MATKIGTPVIEIPETRKLIVKMAKYYVSPFRKKCKLNDVSEKFGVPRRRLTKYFNQDLPKIDAVLAAKVKAKSDASIKANAFKPKTK